MNYIKSVEYINSRLAKKGKKNSLAGIRELLKRLGNPQDNLKLVHVAGTNGKGSTSAYIESILRSNGYKTGLFTSPYIEVINERIKINNQNITDDEFSDAANTIKLHVDAMEQDGDFILSFFDILTAMCFYTFNKAQVDIAVIETGIGGKYDSTNIINPIMSIITTIGYDHMSILGNTIEEIASNKAGIIKENTPVIIAPQNFVEAYAIVLNESKNKNAPLYNLDDTGILINNQGLKGSDFTFSYGSLKASISTPLLGAHQVINASVAFFAMCILSQTGNLELSPAQILGGIKSVKWHGRCEVVCQNPLIILDGAHNEQSIKALIKTIRSIYPIGKVNIVFGIQKSKNRQPILKDLSNIADSFYLFSNFSNKFADIDDLKDELTEINAKYEISDTLNDSLQHVVDNSTLPIIICGSLYIVGPAKHILSDIL